MQVGSEGESCWVEKEGGGGGGRGVGREGGGVESKRRRQGRGEEGGVFIILSIQKSSFQAGKNVILEPLLTFPALLLKPFSSLLQAYKRQIKTSHTFQWTPNVE